MHRVERRESVGWCFVVTDEGSKPEILSKIAHTTAALTRLKPVWNDRSDALPCHIIFLYAYESWTLRAELKKRKKKEYKPWK